MLTIKPVMVSCSLIWPRKCAAVPTTLDVHGINLVNNVLSRARVRFCIAKLFESLGNIIITISGCNIVRDVLCLCLLLCVWNEGINCIFGLEVISPGHKAGIRGAICVHAAGPCLLCDSFPAWETSCSILVHLSHCKCLLIWYWGTDRGFIGIAPTNMVSAVLCLDCWLPQRAFLVAMGLQRYLGLLWEGSVSSS